MNSMMFTSKLITWVLFFGLVAAATFDVWLGTKFGMDATISEFIMRASRAYPIIPLIVGVILGHFFWPQVPPIITHQP